MKRLTMRIIILIIVVSGFLVLNMRDVRFNENGNYIGNKRIILVSSDTLNMFEEQKKVAEKNELTFSKEKIMILSIDPNHRLIQGHPGKHVFVMDFDGTIKYSNASVISGKKIAGYIKELNKQKGEILSE